MTMSMRVDLLQHPQATSDSFEDSETQILVLEYKRALYTEQFYQEHISRQLTFYLSVLIGGISLQILLRRPYWAQYVDGYAVTLLTLVMLALGLVLYNDTITRDIFLVMAVQKRERLRRLLFSNHPDFSDILEAYESFDQDPSDWQKWSSIRALIRRAILFSGAKSVFIVGNTIVVILGMRLNCCFLPLIPTNWIGIALIAVGAIATIVLHLAYSSLRYRMGLRNPIR
jgi:hypothetical protein